MIQGLKPWDGRYELPEPDTWTVREWGWIKRYSSYLPAAIQEGFAGGDPELVLVFALIALSRAGKVDPPQVSDLHERLVDVAPFDDDAVIRLETVTEEAEEVEPSPPESSSNGSATTSGDDSTTSSETLVLPPRPTGTPGWATSESGRPTSES